MKAFKQSLLLFLSFLFIFIWQNTQLSQITVQVLAGLVFLYLILSVIRKDATGKRGFRPIDIANQGDFGIVILNTIIILFVIATGGFSSMLFFLLFFLAFALSFALEPITVFIFVIGVIALFLPEVIKNYDFRNIIMLGSLALLSPLAYFFGREYRKEGNQTKHIQKLNRQTKEAANNIAQDIEDVLHTEEKALSSQGIEKINHILEETEALRQHTKE